MDVGNFDPNTGWDSEDGKSVAGTGFVDTVSNAAEAVSNSIEGALDGFFGFGVGYTADGNPGGVSEGGADQDAIRAEEARKAAAAKAAAERQAAEEARAKKEAEEKARINASTREDERLRATRASQIATDERARNRRISAMRNGQTSSILTSPNGLLNPIYTTSNNLWGLQPKKGKKLLGQ